MSYLKNFCCGFVCCCCGHLLLAQGSESNIKKSAFRITGSVGTSANFYTSNEAVSSRPSFAWNVYGNFTPRYKKFSFPFSFVTNQYSKSNSSPYLQIGISPTYQWARLHIGYRYIHFSPLTFYGQSFKGAGLELNPKHFRFAAFYGKLNKAVNEDTSSGRYKIPQYSRTGYGIKIGIGDANRFLDVMYFHAKDDSSSASFISNNSKTTIRAQENAVLGSSFRLPFLKKLIWTSDAAISGLVQDLANNKLLFDSVHPSLKRFINHFLPTNSSTVARYAAQSSLSYYSNIYNSSFSYRRVEPNFKSLGTPYIINDVELVSWLNNLTLAKGKFNFNTSLSHQHNNLDHAQPVSLKTDVANINMNAILSQHFNVNLNFSGYNLKQTNNDTLFVKDSLLINQRISQYGISPSYNFTKGNYLHYFSANMNLQTLKDKNPTTSSQANSNNLATSINYMLAFLKKPLSFSINYLHSRYKQSASNYTSNGITVGSSGQLLKNRNLNVQGNVGYFFNRFNNNNAQKNITYSVSSSYNSRHHSFNVYANYIYTPSNPINDIINTRVLQAVASNYLAGGATYTYTF